MTICSHCPIRYMAEKRPESWLGRLWRWHTTWCPGWKAYQRRLEERKIEESATQGSESRH